MTARPDLAAPTPERHLPYPWARCEGCGGPRPAHLIRPAALALGFDPRQLAHVLGERPCHD